MVTVPVKVLYVGGYGYLGDPLYTETILQANDVILFPGPENMRRIIEAHNNVSSEYVDAGYSNQAYPFEYKDFGEQSTTVHPFYVFTLKNGDLNSVGVDANGQPMFVVNESGSKL